MNDINQLKFVKSEINFHEGDSVNILDNIKQSFHCIYLDPPFGTGRKFEFSAHKDKRGFNDIWKEGEYEQWLEEIISSRSVLLRIRWPPSSAPLPSDIFASIPIDTFDPEIITFSEFRRYAFIFETSLTTVSPSTLNSYIFFVLGGFKESPTMITETPAL